MLVGNSLRFQKLSPPPLTASTPPPQGEGAPVDSFEPHKKDEFTVGDALLTGLSLLGAATSLSPQPAMAAEVVVEAPIQNACHEEMPVARAIVIDNFWNADKNTTHGELVEAELIRAHQVDGEDANLVVERQHVSLWGGNHGIGEGRPGALENHLRDHFAGRMNRDAEAMQRILDGGGQRAVIHQSQGASQSRAIEGLFNRARNDENYRARLQEQMGMEVAPLETDADKAEFLNALVREADAMYRSDSAVIEARQNLRALQDQLHEQGYIHVMSAGNQGRLSREMDRLGLAKPDGFFTNDFASEHTIIVGASDNQSKEAEGGEHAVAQLASPDAGAHFAADGVDRPLFVDGEMKHHSGSSYAAPQGSSMILRMMRVDSDITRDETLAQLQDAAEPMPGSESFLGAGILSTPDLLRCN